MYSQKHFLATNSLPKYELSQLVCFLDTQYNGMLFLYIRNPFPERHVTVSLKWSASNLDAITKPNPRGAGIFSGRSSLPETCQKLLEVQS